MSEPTIAGLAARLAARELSAVELARDTLERIARLDPALNAFVTVDAEGALAQAPARPARVLRHVPRVARQAVEARQPGRQHAVVRHRRLAQQHGAGLAQPRRRRRVLDRRHQRGGRAAQRHRHAARGDVLLEHRRHAVEQPARRAAPPALLGCACLRQRALGVECPGGIQVRLAGGDAVEHRPRHLDRRDVAMAVQRAQGSGGEIMQGRHRKSPSIFIENNDPIVVINMRQERARTLIVFAFQDDVQ